MVPRSFQKTIDIRQTPTWNFHANFLCLNRLKDSFCNSGNSRCNIPNQNALLLASFPSLGIKHGVLWLCTWSHLFILRNTRSCLTRRLSGYIILRVYISVLSYWSCPSQWRAAALGSNLPLSAMKSNGGHGALVSLIALIINTGFLHGSVFLVWRSIDQTSRSRSVFKLLSSSLLRIWAFLRVLNCSPMSQSSALRTQPNQSFSLRNDTDIWSFEWNDSGLCVKV